MTYTPKASVRSQTHTNTQRKASTMWKFCVLNLAVRKDTVRLFKVNYLYLGFNKSC